MRPVIGAELKDHMCEIQWGPDRSNVNHYLTHNNIWTPDKSFTPATGVRSSPDYMYRKRSVGEFLADARKERVALKKAIQDSKSHTHGPEDEPDNTAPSVYKHPHPPHQRH